MSTYGQFCPVAKAMDLLDERWTLLVVRELVAGSTHFNDLRRGLPKMSPALLSKRLRTLERGGVIRRRERSGRISYELTESGHELKVAIEALGVWGMRWISELGEEELDPHLLMWDMRRRVPIDAWPRTRTILHFAFDDMPAREARWWIVVADGHADVCDFDPGFDVTATISTSLRTMTRIWRGDISWAEAFKTGSVVITGSAGVAQAVPAWLGHSAWADVPRPVRVAEQPQPA
ncbi:winged helix-turn-helix transcriptional regulator [Homoserinimonas sp. A447]